MGTLYYATERGNSIKANVSIDGVDALSASLLAFTEFTTARGGYTASHSLTVGTLYRFEILKNNSPWETRYGKITSGVTRLCESPLEAINADATLATPDDVSVSVSSTPIITIPAAVAVASQRPNVITAIRGDTLSYRLPTLGDLTGWTKIVFTAKVNPATEADAAAILQVVINNPGDAGDGLIYLNSEPADDESEASLTVADVDDGLVDLAISNLATYTLTCQTLFWDCQVHKSAVTSTPKSGTMVVEMDVTRAIT